MRRQTQKVTHKSTQKSTQKSIHFTCKIKILLAYLGKLLYLCGIFFAIENERFRFIGVCSSESALEN
jgi:hypothetical protein